MIEIGKLTKIDCLDIIIPTIREIEEIDGEIKEIERTAYYPHSIIVTSLKERAAINRNFGLECAKEEIVIMLDDDMTGFFPNWDKELVAPFFNDPLLCMISARLMDKEGRAGPNCAGNYDLGPEYIYIPKKKDAVMPSAAIAFRNIGLRFDIQYVGSGWEDTDFAFQYAQANPNFKFMINNRCKLIHLNEMKNQVQHFDENKKRFYKKWNIT